MLLPFEILEYFVSSLFISLLLLLFIFIFRLILEFVFVFIFNYFALFLLLLYGDILFSIFCAVYIFICDLPIFDYLLLNNINGVDLFWFVAFVYWFIDYYWTCTFGINILLIDLSLLFMTYSNFFISFNALH